MSFLHKPIKMFLFYQIRILSLAEDNQYINSIIPIMIIHYLYQCNHIFLSGILQRHKPAKIYIFALVAVIGISYSCIQCDRTLDICFRVNYNFKTFQWLIFVAFPVERPSGEWHRTTLIIMLTLVAWRHEAIISTNVRFDDAILNHLDSMD